MPGMRCDDHPACRHAGLTPREAQMLRLVADGCTNREIACRLRIGTQTVKNQLCVLMEKMGARNRVQLAVYAVTRELI